MNPTLSYKASTAAPHHPYNTQVEMLSQENQNENLLYEDPCVDTIPKVVINQNFYFKVIRDAIEYQQIGDRTNLIRQLEILVDNSNFFTGNLINMTQLIKQTDVCLFLLNTTAQGTDVELRNLSIKIIEFFMRSSEVVVDEFLRLNAMPVFACLTHIKSIESQTLSFNILQACIKTPKGISAFVNSGRVQMFSENFRTIFSIPNPTNLQFNFASRTASIFCDLLKHSDIIPIGMAEQVFLQFVKGLDLRFDFIFFYATNAAINLVSKLGDKGNEIIYQAKLVEKIMFILETDFQDKVSQVLVLLAKIFSQSEKEIKFKIFEQVKQESLIKLFLKVDINSEIFNLLMSTICNCFLIGMNFNWIVKDECQNIIQRALNEGSFACKSITIRVWLAASLLSNEDMFRELMKTEIVVSVVNTVPSLSDNDMISSLKLIAKIYRKLCIYGITQSECFDNAVAELCLPLLNNENKLTNDIAKHILEHYLPDLYYS